MSQAGEAGRWSAIYCSGITLHLPGVVTVIPGNTIHYNEPSLFHFSPAPLAWGWLIHYSRGGEECSYHVLTAVSYHR